MFELNGETTTIEKLQNYAKQQGIDFDTYFSSMKKKGMTEIQPTKVKENNTEDFSGDVVFDVKKDSKAYSAQNKFNDLDYKNINVVKDIDTSPTGLFFNVLQDQAPGLGTAISALAGLVSGGVKIVDSIGDFVEMGLNLLDLAEASH